VIATGRLGTAHVEVLLRVVAAALCIRGATTLSLDLSRVVYIDAAGVAGLLECQRQTHQLGRTFVLAPVSPQVLAGIGACVAGRLLYSASRITDVVPDGNSLRPPGRQRRRLFCSRPPRSRGGTPPAQPRRP
jgi:ABC-type transporter Mla MlaB component